MNPNRLLLLSLIVLAMVGCLAACDGDFVARYDQPVSLLPVDSGGTLGAVPSAGLPGGVDGYCLYTPGGYAGTSQKYPAIVLLHGDGFFVDQGGSLSGMLGWAINYQIQQKRWHPAVPMLVFCPQGTQGKDIIVNNVVVSSGGFKISEIDAFTDYIVANYRVDPHRMYLTGVSHGVGGVYSYINNYGDKSRYAAAVPVIGSGGALTKVRVPVWAFAGELDTTAVTADCIATIDSIKKNDPGLDAKITVFGGWGHDGNLVNAVYGYTDQKRALSAYAPFDMDICSWLLQFRRP